MSFVTGATNFGIFDADPQFQADADKLVQYVTKKLGSNTLDVELSASDVYASFEEACLEYSAIVNQYQFKSVAATVLGAPTGSLSGSENKFPESLLELQRRLASAYDDAAGVDSKYPLLSASITLEPGKQSYDLQTILSGSGVISGSQRISLKDVFHFSPLSAYRFFGTTSAVNYLNNQFSFESFTPETIFYLLPIWEDVLRGSQFKLSNKVRRSNYSFEVNNNVLKLYPTPTDAQNLYFTYFLPKDPFNPGYDDPKLSGVANLSNVPFGNINYSQLNSIGKHWIRRMTFALSQEILGLVRRKMSTIPIPNGDLTLDGGELVTDAKALQDELRTELKEILDATTYDKIVAAQAEMAEQLRRNLAESPLPIYIGVFWLFLLPLTYLSHGQVPGVW